MRRWLAALLCLPLAGCVTLQFDRRRAFEPVDEAALGELRDGRADLATCLARLGAPNLVREQPDGRMVLVWFWLDHFGWGINVSVSLRGYSVSADVDRDQRNLEAAALFFDREQRLVGVRRGLLRDFLTHQDRRRPTLVE